MGNYLGMIGVGTGCLATLGAMAPVVAPATLVQMGALLAAGTAVGVGVSSRVQLTELPPLVAAFHSFVGAAAVATAVSSYLSAAALPHDVAARWMAHLTRPGSAEGAGITPARRAELLGAWEELLNEAIDAGSLSSIMDVSAARLLPPYFYSPAAAPLTL